jgi:hypothetical protein
VPLKETTMNYERLTVDRFELNLKEGKYAGLTGARRAIGKANWTTKEREKAKEIANKFFDGGKPSVAKTKAPKPEKKAAKAPKPEKKAAKPAKVKAAKKTAPTIPSTKRAAALTPPAAGFELQLAGVVRVGNLDDTRFNGTCAVISGFANRGSLTPAEQRAYDISLEEFALLAQPAAKAAVKRQPVTSTPETQGDGSPAVQPNERVAAPKVTIPKVDLSTMTVEQREEHTRLVAAVKALPTTLGQQA